MKCLLGMDIGGTNTQACIFDESFNVVLVHTFKTKQTHPYDAMDYVIKEAKEKQLTISAAGIAIAGPVKDNAVSMLNARYQLSLKEFNQRLPKAKVALLNDFAAVAYGINVLKQKDCIPLTKNTPKDRAIKIVLGAGTGLGKAIVHYDILKEMYVPIPSEEGHAMLPIQTPQEFELLSFLKKKNNEDACWEHVLSGRGLASLYDFARKGRQNKIAKEIQRTQDKASLISKYQKEDPYCKKAFEWFCLFYARFIRNSALQSLPYGGIYIAGGIARKNPNIFSSKAFQEEMKKKDIVRIIADIPLFLISDEHVGAKGAAFVAVGR